MISVRLPTINARGLFRFSGSKKGAVFLGAARVPKTKRSDATATLR